MFLTVIEASGFTVYASKIREELIKQVRKKMREKTDATLKKYKLFSSALQEAAWQADCHRLSTSRQLGSSGEKDPCLVFLQTSSQVLAEQLTLFDSALYRRVTPVEFVNHIRTKKDEGKLKISSPDVYLI